MLNSEELRFAIQDARTRHAAIVELIYATDRQAMALLGLYITLGLASASGFVAGLNSDSIVPAELAAALFVAVLMFFAGIMLCFRAMKLVDINLPGRTADFWIWADGPSLDATKAYREYLQELDQKHATNDKVSNYASIKLAWAKRIGLWTPMVSAAGGIAYHLLLRFI
jgi:hypothetical protein